MQGRRELILIIIAMARAWCELRFVPEGRGGNRFLEEGGQRCTVHSGRCLMCPGFFMTGVRCSSPVKGDVHSFNALVTLLSTGRLVSFVP